MANNIKGLTVEIGGDTTKLGKALENVNKKSRDLSSELGQINKLLKLNPDNADLLAQKQKVLADAVSNTREKLDTLKTAEKQVQEQFERGEASEEQVRALQREIVSTTGKLESYERAAQETAEAVEKLGKSEKDTKAVSLSKTVEEQSSRLKELKAEYVDIVAAQGKNSSAAKELKKKIQTLSGELKENKDRLSDAEKAADEAADGVDNFADSADKAEKSSDGLGSKLGGALKTGLVAVAGLATAAVGAMVGAAETTREYRTAMGKLNTAFTQNGFSTEAATSAYKELQGVLGDSDVAVEASNHLAKLTDNEKDLSTWTGNILPGVFATFGDSLPIEGLTEAANETAKVGQVTGPLADALNWAGVSEDAFNSSLEKCSNEQERQALITETLSKLYGNAAKAYKETNSEVIRANEANEAWTASMAEIGGAVEPIITDVKLLGASLLSDLLPGISGVAEGFRGVLNGDKGAAQELGSALSGIVSQLLSKVTELAPTIVSVAISLITTLTTTLVSMLPQLVTTGVQLIMTIVAGLTSAIPQLVAAISAAIPQLVTALVTGIPQLLQGAVQLFLALVQAIPQIVPPLIDAIPQLLQAILDGLTAVQPQLLAGAIQFLMAILDAFPSILSALGQSVPLILKAIITVLSRLPGFIGNIFKSVLDKVGSWALNMANKAKTAGSNFINNAIKIIRQLPNKVWTWLLNVINKVTTWASSLGKKGASAARALVSNVINGVKGLPGRMASIGSDLVRGLANGISNMTSWVLGKIKSFSSSILSGIKGFFGIKSPSRVMRDQVGKMLPAGIAVGIEAAADEPLKAINKLNSDLLDESGEINGLTLEKQIKHTFNRPSAATQHSLTLSNKLDKILTAIERGQILTIDGSVLVGATLNQIDRQLGQRRALTVRGAL